MNLAVDMEQRAQEAPNRVGLIFEDGTRFTFKELNELSSRAANLLRSLGIAKGVRVGIYMQNSPEFVAMMYGCWKIGGVLVPINVMYQKEELRHALQTTGVSVLITQIENMDRVEKVRDILKVIILTGSEADSFPDVVAYEKEIMKMDAHCPAITCSEEDEAVILFTGGTTGWPKAVITTHDGSYVSLANLARASRGRPGPYPIASPSTPPTIVALPLFHSGGEQTFLFAYHVGRTVVLMKRFHIQKFVELINTYQANTMVLLPTMFFDLVNYEGDIDISTVKSALFTGGELSSLIRKRFEERFHIPIMQNYGSTEVGHVAGWTMVDFREGRWKAGSAGRVYDGVEVEIRDENDRSLPPGEIGEICVKSRVSTEGYAGEERKESQLVIKNGWIYAEDIGYLDQDRCLFLVGRKRDLIKCGGFQIYPSEIEEVLLKYHLIKDVCVTGVPDERMGHIPKAFVVLRTKPESPVEEEKIKEDIIEYCRANLAHFKAIRAVAFLDELPRSETGKLMKALLTKQD